MAKRLEQIFQKYRYINDQQSNEKVYIIFIILWEMKLKPYWNSNTQKYKILPAYIYIYEFITILLIYQYAHMYMNVKQCQTA